MSILTGRSWCYMLVPAAGSASLLGCFDQQPQEVLDYDIDFTDWCENRSDSISSLTVTCDAGMMVDGWKMNGNVAKVLMSGGVDGDSYKVTVRAKTTAGAVREADFRINSKEV